jgi:hypothetical protein
LLPTAATSPFGPTRILIHPEDAGNHPCGIINAEKHLLVLLYHEDDSAGYLYLRQQVKVSENEKYFAVLFEVLAHKILKHKQVIFIVIVIFLSLEG